MSADVNVSFCRTLLADTIDDVRSAEPGIVTAKAWVWSGDRRTWEFHFGEFYWHGNASNAYEARALGWSAWLKSKGYE